MISFAVSRTNWWASTAASHALRRYSLATRRTSSSNVTLPPDALTPGVNVLPTNALTP